MIKLAFSLMLLFHFAYGQDMILFDANKTILPSEYSLNSTVKASNDTVKSVVVTEKYIAVATYSKVVLYDKEQFRRVRNIRFNDMWVNTIYALNDMLYIGLGDGTIELYNLKTRRKISKITAHKLSTLSIKANKDFIVSSSADGTIAVFRNEEPFEKLYTLKNHQWDVSAFDIAKNKIVSGSDDYTIKIWDLNSSKLIKTLKSAHDGDINCVVVDNNKIFSASSDKTINIRDLQTGKLIKTLKGHKKAVNTLFVQDGYLISGSDDRSIIVWDLKNYIAIKKLKGHIRGISSIVAIKNNIISGGKDYTVRVWNKNKKNKESLKEEDMSIYSLLKTHDFVNGKISSLLTTPNEYVIANGNKIYFFDTLTLDKRRVFSTTDKIVIQLDDNNNEEEEEEEDDDDEDDDENEDINGNYPVTDIKSDGAFLMVSYSKYIKIWDLETNNAILALEDSENKIKNINLTDDYYISGLIDGVVNIWDRETNELLNSIKAHNWDVTSTVFYDDKIFSASRDYSIRIWDIESGDLVGKIKFASEGIVEKLDICNDILISSDNKGNIIKRDIESRKIIEQKKISKYKINDFTCFENNMILTIDDGTMQVRNLKSLDLIKEVSDNNESFSKVLVYDDYLITSNKNNKIKVWKNYE